jgi:hypothetical protein
MAIALYTIAVAFLIQLFRGSTTDDINPAMHVTYAFPWELRLFVAIIATPVIGYQFLRHIQQFSRAVWQTRKQ